ncbi:MAG: hypothetical protein JWL77_1212 [Chthonomonadaceae bacterium]|nr:hypothetical protein [Chthonomonadaceae bacterium]
MLTVEKLTRRSVVGSCFSLLTTARVAHASDLEHLLPLEALLPSRYVPPARDTSLQQLWDTTAHQAFTFFWEETSPITGLTKDRARNLLDAPPDSYNISSIASSGYMLSALVIGVERGWIDPSSAIDRALLTLRFVGSQMEHQHGFYYHFVDLHSGRRIWKSEASSIDTALLILGALAAGQYFGGEVAQMAEALYARVDWQWMQARRGNEPADTPLRMGWKPGSGFLDARWKQYDEASFLYLLALGAPKHSLPGSAWDRWGTGDSLMEGLRIPGRPGPLFWAQMAPGYYDLNGLRDRANRSWWQLWGNTHQAHYNYCARRPQLYPHHQETLWGINACDQPPAKPGRPNGYNAQNPLDGENDGTVAPTAALAAVTFLPEVADRALQDLSNAYRANAWGRYGFANAINPSRNWFSPDVIGIDLGMMLLAIENHRSGLLWRLMSAHPSTPKALTAAGFHNATG